jgi:hypothetical protein
MRDSNMMGLWRVRHDRVRVSGSEAVKDGSSMKRIHFVRGALLSVPESWVAGGNATRLLVITTSRVTQHGAEQPILASKICLAAAPVAKESRSSTENLCW